MPGIVALLEGDQEALARHCWDLLTGLGLPANPPGALPHLTFHAAESYEADAIAAPLEVIARTRRPFMVECSGFGVFTGDPAVVYLAVTRTPALSELHAAVVGAIEGRARGSGPYWAAGRWVPHITLSMGAIPPQQIGAAAAILASAPLAFELPVRSLALIDDRGGEHRLVWRLPLHEEVDNP